VVFSPAYPSTNYIVIISIENVTVGVTGSPQPFYFSIENKSVNGFRINVRNNNGGGLTNVVGPTTFSYAVVPLPVP
jgi:hypothetical protein